MHHFLNGILNPPTEADISLALQPKPTPVPDGVTLYDVATGLPHYCRICHRCDRWEDEGATWVCEHDPIDGLPIRVIDDVRKEAVYERANCGP